MFRRKPKSETPEPEGRTYTLYRKGIKEMEWLGVLITPENRRLDGYRMDPLVEQVVRGS